jgi:hypothetical protein
VRPLRAARDAGRIRHRACGIDCGRMLFAPVRARQRDPVPHAGIGRRPTTEGAPYQLKAKPRPLPLTIGNISNELDVRLRDFPRDHDDRPPFSSFERDPSPCRSG